MAFGEEAADDEAAALAVFGLGAFGFLVGPLVDFLAFDGDLVLLAETEDEAFVATDFFSSAVAFLGLAAVVDFFSGEAFLAFGEATFLTVFTFSPVERLAGAFFALAPAVFLSAADGFVELDVAEANLKEPDAPLPFVCTSDPEATEAFRYFLMNGATFSASTL